MRLCLFAIFFVGLCVASESVGAPVDPSEKVFTRAVRFGSTRRRTTRRRYGCQGGKYDVKTTTELLCADCAPGKYQNSIAQTTCLDCVAGRYSFYPGRTSCSTCPSGSYQMRTGASTCHLCEANKYKATSTSCVDCPSGSTSHGLTGLASSSLCFACPPGQYLDMSTCRDCPENTFSTGSQFKCTPCSSGSYSNPVASVCLECGNSTNAFLENSSSCIACAFGRYSDGAGQTTCHDCPSGRYVVLHGCHDCPTGKYAPQPRSSACLRCSPGFFSTAAATACSSCPTGTSSLAGSSICTACDVGTFAGTANPVCAPCPAGRAQSAIGMSSCATCGAGKFTAQLRSTACSKCAAGSFSAVAAATVCTPCSAGFVATHNLNVPPTSQAIACVPCSVGKFAGTPGLVSCVNCPLGKISATPGAYTCTPCSSGSISPSLGASVCIACAPGEWAPSDASACAPVLDCASTPCQNGGICVPGRSLCTCTPDWLGPLCNVNVAQAACASSPCVAAASICFNSKDALSFSCVCPPGITGTLCEVGVNECLSSPCHNGATCHNNIFSFSCSCSPGTSGRLCELIVDLCASSPCANGAACSNTISDFLCTCTAAFTGRTCSTILEACVSSPCANGGTCVTGPSRFSVTQLRSPLQRYVSHWFYFSDAPPASGNATLTIVATNSVYASSNYLYIAGPFGELKFFDLGLPPGQSLYSQSIELTPETIGSLRDSSDTIVFQVLPTTSTYPTFMSYLRLSLEFPTFETGFSCACPVGYTGNACETLIGDCASGPCASGGTCLVDNTGVFVRCACPLTNTGTFCESKVVARDCDSSPCFNDGVCINIEPGTPYIREIEHVPAAYGFTLVYTFPLIGSSTPAGGTLMIASNADLRSPSETIIITGANGFSHTFFSNDWTTDCEPRYDQLHLSADNITSLRGHGNTSIIFTARFSSDVTPGICAQPSLRLSLSFGQANTHMCNCSANFTGVHCETPIDDCLFTPCLNGGSCTTSAPSDRVSTSTCACPAGFAGPFCESSVPINYCMSSPCSNGATCVPESSVSDFSCTCLAGFTGVSCESNIDECVSSPCTPFTTVQCIDGIASFVCECVTGLSGTLCSLPDQCFSSPCAHGGVCSTVSPDSLLQYSCDCLPRYSGTNCEMVIGDCASSPCLNGALCQEDSEKLFLSCQCLAGYTGMLCGNVIDECSSSPCANGATCTQPLSGIIQCLCAADYTGELCDVVVDDCESSPCSAGATCVDGIASYVCQCFFGIGGTWCTIVDQCLSSPCSNGATCTSRGKFWSSVTEGPVVYSDVLEFNFSDIEVPISGGTLTVEITNSDLYYSNRYVIVSGKGWVSERLFDTTTPYCGLVTTSITLTQAEIEGLIDNDIIQLYLTPSTYVSAISCPSGDPSRAKLTLLYNFAPQFVCECPAIYSGLACEILSGECISSPCSNGGECLVDEFGSFQGCRCPVGYSGPYCDWVLDACASSPCMYGGSCLSVHFVPSGLLFQCVCLQGFTGLDCSAIIDYCASSPCPLSATCITGTTFAICACAPGTVGSLCDLPDMCVSSPCENGGVCRTTAASVHSQEITTTPVQDNLILVFPFTSIPQPIGDSMLFLKSNASFFAGKLTITGPGGFSATALVRTPQTCDEYSQTLTFNQTELAWLLDGGDSLTLQATPSVPVACPSTFLSMQLQVNTGIGFVCDCPAGWLGTTCGAHARDCVSSPCLNSGTCMDIAEGGFTCLCDTDYTGATCNRRLLPCELSPCSNGATCTSTTGSSLAKCLCAPGFTGRTCETDIDECVSNFCLSSATCVDGVDSYTCVCPSKYYGTFCRIFSNSDWCSSTPCHNGGVCSMEQYESVTVTHDYTIGSSQLMNFTFDGLQLPDGSAKLEATARLDLVGSNSFFTVLGVGDYNQTVFGNSGNPCTSISTETITFPESQLLSLYTNGAITLQVLLSEACSLDLCTDLSPFLQLRLISQTAKGIHCECSYNSTGEFCETFLGDCGSSPCGATGTCSEDGNRQFSGCLCTAGFTGAYCETPVDFCECSPCANGATCLSNTDGFVCECPVAFSGPFCRVSLDMCASSPCALGATCVSYSGGFHCACASGFTGPLCTIPDLCLSSPCVHGASCNTLSSVSLAQTQSVPMSGSNRGSAVFTLTARQPPTGASVISVATNADLSVLDDTLVLWGPYGFSELFFRELLPECVIANASRTLSAAQTASLFSTPTGAFHMGAKVPAQSCFSDVYVWLALSYDVSPFVQCTCPAGFTGEYCEKMETACDSLPCGTLGTCVQDIFGNFRHCMCPLGVTGEFCETYFDACDSAQNPCVNGATCLQIYQTGSVGYVCSCQAGFEGDDCSVNIDNCASSPCAASSTCINGVQAYGCLCAAGTTGPDCSQKDLCASTPCRNGATCTIATAGSTYSSEVRHDISFQGGVPQFVFHGTPQTSVSASLSVVVNANLYNSGNFMTVSGDGGFSVNIFNTYSSERDCIDDTDSESLTAAQLNGLINKTINTITLTTTLVSPTPITCNAPFASLKLQYQSSEPFVLCTCPTGFTGALCDAVIVNNDCDSSPCPIFATCVPLPDHGWTCACPPLLSGSTCQTASPCASSPCSNGGVCTYSGLDSDKEVTVMPSSSVSCCEVMLATFSNLAVPIDSATLEVETNGDLGSANEYLTVSIAGSSFVRNMFGSSAVDCNVRKQTVSVPLDVMLSAMNGGHMLTFEVVGSSYVSYSSCSTYVKLSLRLPILGESLCTCLAGFTGSNCETQIDNCESNPCVEGSTCVNDVTNFLCLCPPGRGGVHCEFADQCGSSPCAHGGVCQTVGTVQETVIASPMDEVRALNFTSLMYQPIGDGNLTISVLGYFSRAYTDQILLTAPGGILFRLFNSYPFPSGVCKTGTQTVTFFQADIEAMLSASDPTGVVFVSTPVSATSSCTEFTYVSVTVQYPTAPEYTCTCTPGFTGVDCTRVLEPCFSSPCHNGGSCVTGPGGGSAIVCTCAAGFTGAACEVDLMGCGSFPCINGGTCSIVTGDVVACACAQGFTGTTCETDIDDCLSRPCLSGFACVDGVNTFTCLLIACESAPCLNGATCVNIVDGFECHCLYGFVGDQCQSIVNFCQSAPCRNGICNSWTGGFDCECDTGYTGQLCDVELNECESSPCANGAVCYDKVGAFLCSCPSSFTGTFCDVDVVGDCAADWCNGNGICSVVSGGRGYDCDCLPGYDGHNCETMVDNCASGPCMSGSCSNVPNGFQCDCPALWLGRFCEIYNPCPASCLIPGAQCLMNYTSTSTAQTTGSLTSPDGYILTLNDVPYVSPTRTAGIAPDGELIITILADVSQGTRLRVVGVSFQAQIVLNYGGPQCLERQHAFLLTSTQIRQMLRVDGTIVILVEIIDGPPLATACVGEFIRAELLMSVPTTEVSCSCSPGHTCRGCGCSLVVGCESCANNAGCTPEGQCVCADGYYGSTCAFQSDICASSPCLNGGECHILNNHFYCDCPIDFQGTMCQSKSECAQNPCMGNAGCVETMDGTFAGCLCGPGTTGVYCDSFILSCSSLPCLNNGICIDLVDQYLCECTAGTTGVQCEVVVDACTSQPCVNGATCQINEFGHTCVCARGFQGALCDVDSDECASLPCANGATCADGVDSFLCACTSGWFGLLCNVDVEECGSAPCSNGATCVDTVDGFLCNCIAGYTGVTCSALAMLCASSPCQNGALCTHGFNVFVCTCIPGFKGVFCEENIDECSSSPCSNGGGCIDAVNGYTCECGTGFAGVQCEVDADECASSPCANGGVCTDYVAAYLCACTPGFMGDTCEESVDECSSKPCVNDGRCTNAVHGYVCHCSTGFTGARCEVDIDECASSPCASGAMCTEGVSAFACVCALGFTGLHCNVQIDECASVPCANGATCLDGVYSFTCVCATGWFGELCDEDLDECVSSPCVNGAHCEDGISGLACVCLPGFAGATCAVDVDECASSPCANEAQCQDIIGGFACVCTTGFTGKHCDMDIDECASVPCVNGGVCVNAVGSFFCICPSGFTDVQCNVAVEACASSPCTNGALCVADVSGLTCACVAGFSGVRCEVEIPTCLSTPCLNGATCVDSVNSYTCLCAAGWFGQTCDADTNECASSPCTNGASCEDSVSEFTCACAAGFTGVRCEVDVDECASSPCTNGASCEDSVSEFTCACASGFTGVRCEVDVDECASLPCTNGASCEDSVSGFTCACATGYTGVRCEVNVDECASLPCTNGAACLDGIASFLCEVANECASSPCANGASCVAESAIGFSCVCLDGFFGEDCTSIGKFISATSGGKIVAPGFTITFPPGALLSTAFVSVSVVTLGTAGAPSAPLWASTASQLYHIVSAGASTFAVKVLVEVGLLPGAPASTSAVFYSAAASIELRRLDDTSGVNGQRRSGSCPANAVCNTITHPGFVVALSALPCASSPCANGATCINTLAGEFVCMCAVGSRGLQCETTVNSCASSPCHNGGACSLVAGGAFTCSCPTGFAGNACETAINACASLPCANGASCTSTGFAFFCSCPLGFVGVQCDSDVDECASSPCASGEVCTDGLASYTCTGGAGASPTLATTHFVIVGAAVGVVVVVLVALIVIVLALRRNRRSPALQLRAPQRHMSQRELMRSESFAEHSRFDAMMMVGMDVDSNDNLGDADADDKPTEFTFATSDLMHEEVA